MNNSMWGKGAESIGGFRDQPGSGEPTSLLFLMLTGLRTSEGRALRWEDVDLKNNVLHIRGSFDLEVYKTYTKNKDDHYLPLGEAVK